MCHIYEFVECTIAANVYETNQGLLGHSSLHSGPIHRYLRYDPMTRVKLWRPLENSPLKSESLVSGGTLSITKGTEYT
jgi:hypothetical protein